MDIFNTSCIPYELIGEIEAFVRKSGRALCLQYEMFTLMISHCYLQALDAAFQEKEVEKFTLGEILEAADIAAHEYVILCDRSLSKKEFAERAMLGLRVAKLRD